MNSASDSKKLRVYTASIVIIIIGIIALVTAAVISLMKSANLTLWVCEGIALACLIGALIAVILARKHIYNQEEKIRLNPYANVDRKEIDKVLDMISREEVRRKRSEDFAAGISPDAGSSGTADEAHEDAPDENELRFLVIDDHEEDNNDDDEDRSLPIVFPDKDEYDGGSDKKDADDSVAESSESESAGEDSEAKEKEDDEMNRGYDDYDDRAPRRRSQDAPDRRERDPYYDDYYDDRSRAYGGRDRDMRDPYGSRESDGVYYNEYGEPVRRRRPAYDPYYDDYYADRPRQRSARDPRDARSSRDPYARDPYASRDRDGVYYNEYGEPVRRRRPAAPYDDRRQGQPRRRRPDGYPDARSAGRYDDRYEEETSRRTAAPVAPEIPVAPADNVAPAASAPAEAAPAPKAPDYDDNYVPIVIPDDDYDYEASQSAHSGRAGVGSLHRSDAPKAPAAQSAYRGEPARADDRRYTPSYDEEGIPVALPDDDYFENRYSSADHGSSGYQRDSYRQTPPPPPPQSSQSGRTRDRYVPDYEDEEMVVSLPRDDEYDSYLEKKREDEERKREEEALAEQQRIKEQKKAERIASGKIVLTIVKIRRRKIRRKSRKYKQFRASVHHLNEYLHSFSAKTGNN